MASTSLTSTRPMSCSSLRRGSIGTPSSCSGPLLGGRDDELPHDAQHGGLGGLGRGGEPVGEDDAGQPLPRPPGLERPPETAGGGAEAGGGGGGQPGGGAEGKGGRGR